MKSSPRHILLHVRLVDGPFDQLGAVAKVAPERTISTNLVRAESADSFSSETLDTFAMEVIRDEVSVAEAGE